MKLTDYHILPRSFYNRPTVVVAKDLLGKYLVRKLGNDTLMGKISEVEAYLPFGDEAAHNFIGKTKRNETIFGETGHTYVHAMRQYFCLDIGVEEVNVPGSILIRSIIPVCGIPTMMKLRKKMDEKKLTDGPAKVCQALAITRKLNGIDITKADSPIIIVNSNEKVKYEIITTKRIGITKAADKLLRFYITG
jgi:DNA-3-methyladenine glycosylase